jgi:hypothetical protein
VVAAGLLFFGGCRAVDPFRSVTPPAPVIFESAPDLRQLTQAINANSAAVRQLSCDVHVRIDGVPPLSGTLIVEKPRRMRLKAGLVGISEMGIDVGSNDDEFWVWNKTAIGGQVPTILHDRHNEFALSAARQSLPLEPQWVIDAIGLMTLPEDATLQGPFVRPDGRYELRQELTTAGGKTTKTIVVDSKTGLVYQQSIYDANQNLLAYVDAVHHEYFAEHQTSLPRQIKIVAIGPDRKRNTLTVDLAGHKINQLYGDPDRQWLRPQPADAQSIDLARVQ